MKYIYSIIVVLAIVVFFTSSVQAQGSACLPIAKKEQFLKNIILMLIDLQLIEEDIKRKLKRQ